MLNKCSLGSFVIDFFFRKNYKWTDSTWNSFNFEIKKNLSTKCFFLINQLQKKQVVKKHLKCKPYSIAIVATSLTQPTSSTAPDDKYVIIYNRKYKILLYSPPSRHTIKVEIHFPAAAADAASKSSEDALCADSLSPPTTSSSVQNKMWEMNVWLVRGGEWEG